MSTHTSLHGVEEIGRALLSEQLEINLAHFLSWGLLGVGAFFNVHVPSGGGGVGNTHRLRAVDDPHLEDYQAWQGYRQDWVWETGVNYHTQPLRVSGVYVNGGFHPCTGTGAYAHHVDYPRGRVVFDTPLPASSVVTCEFSPRYVQVFTSDSPWWRQLQLESFRADSSHFAQPGSGAWSVLAENRVQLPCVVVEAVPRTSRYGTAIGGGATVRQEVLFHVVAETPTERKRLHDVLTYQWGKRTVLYDYNAVAEADAFPLDGRGTPASGARMYPDLVKPAAEGGFGWRQLRWQDFTSAPQPDQVTAPFYAATVRGVFEVDLP